MRTSMDSLGKLVDDVARAIREYDSTGDHHHGGGPVPGDCVRCALVLALPGWARGDLRVEAKSIAR